MRVMLKVQIPVDAGNRALRDGSLQQAMQSTVERLQPEAAYFYLENGRRTAIMVFNMDDQGQLPVIAEPLFQGLSAMMEVVPVMNSDDLQRGLALLG